ncbi:MAG: recombinase family protein [Oligoflexales bacterium]|nr:recombinase family protein [Oligoflexales bacterium]
MKSVAVYYRVSTDKQDVESQRHAVEKWLDELPEIKKPEKIHCFQDEGISGSSINRPAFKKMLDAAYAGKIDTIIVYRLDRFSRHATTAIRLILNLDEIGVIFISVTQPVLNFSLENPFRRTMLAAFAEIAELERETIVARVVSGLEAARKRGVVLGAPKKITEEKREEILKLRKSGHSIRNIAHLVGLSVGSVAQTVQSVKE